MIYVPRQKLDTQKARNFTHREVARSQMASRLGIDNTPPSDVLEGARLLAINILQPLRDEFETGFSPNSWYRCESLEKVICQSSFLKWATREGLPPYENGTWMQYFKRKQHPTGMAADIEIPGISNDRLFDFIKGQFEFDQLIREFPKTNDPMSGWVHVSYREEGNRQQAFTIG